MPAHHEERDDQQKSGSVDASQIPAQQSGSPLQLKMLAAMVFVPAVCFYLSKYLVQHGRASFKRRRPSHPEGSRASARRRAEQRIPIPIPAESPLSSNTIEASAATPAQSSELPQIPAAPFVGSALQDRFHYPTCRWASNILDVHRVTFGTREDAMSKGYAPCGSCKP